MKNLFIIIFAIATVCSSKIVGQSQLRIELKSEKNEFQLGEPVIVHTTVTNAGAEPVQVFAEARPETDIYRYFITDPDGNTRPFGPIYIEEPEEVKVLGQNESIVGSARIFYGGEGYYFPKPGKYKIQVKLNEATSNSLVITVLPPRTENEQEQARLVLEHPEVGFYLMIDGSDALSDAIAQIDLLREKYPNSVLTSYFLYATGKNLSIPKRNFISKKPREANLPEAINLLESIKNSEIQFYYRNKIFLTLASCYTQLERNEDARRVLLEFRRILDTKKDFGQYYIEDVELELEKLQ